MPAVVFGYLWVKNQREIASTINSFLGIITVASGLITLVALLVNYFGMWIYLFSCDDSRWRHKALWVVLFFFTGPIATVPYFFLAYKRQFAAYPRT